jgi:lysophospholipase L1-like esterase
MKTIFTSAICFMTFLACAQGSSAIKIQDPKIPARKTISYLALGDSYTIGESVTQKSSFPFQLADSLRKKGVLVSDIKVIAKTGWTTSDLKTAIGNENINRKFDVVSLLIGVNNQFRGYSQSVYREEFVELLKTAISFADGDAAKVFVISIPDWGATPFGGNGANKDISRQIDQFNLINKEESLKLHVNYTNITPTSRKVISNTSWVAGDGLHPSGKMYGLWVHELLRQFK